jgi:membrane protease YdiL (CAAX protease family)
MSPEEPHYLPSDSPQPDPANVQQTPAERYAVWDRGDDLPRPPMKLPPMREGLFGFLEQKPGQQEFGTSISWAIAYFFAALLACIVFLIAAQLIPAILATVGVIIWMIATRQNFAGNALQNAILMPALALAQVVTILFSILALLFMLGIHWPRRIGLRLPSAWHFLLTLLMVPAVVLLANAAYAIARRYLPGISDLGLPGMEDMVKTFGTWPWYLAVLIIGLGPGLGEELWCRGFLGLGLFGRNGIVARVMVASFFFGLIHGDPRQGTMAALMGLCLHYIYLTTRSLWMPILVHALNNSTSVLGARFETAKVLDQEPEMIPWYLYAGAAVLFVTLAISLYHTHARLKNERPDEPPLWQPTYPGVEHPPPGCGVVVAYPRPGLLDFGLVFLGAATFGCAIAWAALTG